MGNRDVINDPEIFTREKREREFQERARAMHERLKSQDSLLFTMGEFWIPGREGLLYTQEDVDWMEELEIIALS